MPNIDPADYRLRVDGLVETPATFSLADLKALPRAEQVSDFHCVTGWSRRRRPLGRRPDRGPARARRGRATGAVALRFVSAEVPYEDSLTLEQALLPDVMLAYEMDGAPLSRPHGAPVRLVMPQMYGYKSVKWVEHIELGRPGQGYWEQHGYDADAWIGRSNGFSA